MNETNKVKEAIEKYLFNKGWTYNEGFISINEGYKDPKNGKICKSLGLCYFIQTVRDDLEKYKEEKTSVRIYSNDLTSNNITVIDSVTGETLV